MDLGLNTLLPLISLVVALFGGIPGIISALNYIKKSKVTVSYDHQQSFIALLASDKKNHTGNKVIGFYEIKFVGGEITSTVKNIQFSIKGKRKWFSRGWYEGKQLHLRTNDLADHKLCVVFGGTEKSIVLTDWINFKNDSDQHYIKQGETSVFNIAFEFDKSVKNINEAAEWKFLITDHSNKKYETKIKFPVTTNMTINDSSAKYILFDCYLNSSSDTFEILKDINSDVVDINYLKIQSFLKSKYNHSEEWYDK